MPKFIVLAVIASMAFLTVPASAHDSTKRLTFFQGQIWVGVAVHGHRDTRGFTRQDCKVEINLVHWRRLATYDRSGHRVCRIVPNRNQYLSRPQYRSYDQHHGRDRHHQYSDGRSNCDRSVYNNGRVVCEPNQTRRRWK